MIDNAEGFSATVGHPLGEVVMISDNKIYGETEITDCPSDGSYCFAPDKVGFVISSLSEQGKKYHPEMLPMLPLYKAKSEGVWGGAQRFYRNEFYNFKSSTAEGKSQRLLGLLRYISDYHCMAEFYDTKFIDVDEDAVAYLMDPNPAWAAIDDCGSFPCTAPSNALLTFEDTTF